MSRYSMWVLAPAIFLNCFAITGEAAGRVWLLENREITEYNPLDWSVVHRIKIPAEISGNSEGLQIVPSGAMIFSPDSHAGSRYPGNGAEGGVAWIWDGKESSSLRSGCSREVASAVECRESVRESCPRIAMSHDGRELFWFTNEFETVKEVDGPDVSVSVAFRAWRTDLSGSGRTQIADFSFPPCVCATGACPETCPEADIWFPADGIDDFFIVRHFIEGQLGSTPVDGFVYRKAGEKWSPSRFSQIFDAVLDAGAGGDTVVYAVQDSGCCGWDNDSDDRTALSSQGTVRVIFDERERFSNPDYDVSFYTSKALLSPDESRIAVNLAATHRQSDDIRLSDAGQENPKELARIREAIKTMPSVEVIQASGPKSPLVSIPNASLAGWLNEEEILVVREGALVRCAITTNVCTNTPVAVQKDSVIFVR